MSPPSASANCLAISIFFCSLMPRPTATMISACVRSTACLASLKDFRRFVADHAIRDVDGHRLDRSCAGAGFGLVAAKCAVLEGGEPWASLVKLTSAASFALKHLASEDELAAFVLESDAVANNGTSHGRRKLRDEIAHLVGVRHQYELRLLGAEEIVLGLRRKRRAYTGRASRIRSHRPSRPSSRQLRRLWMRARCRLPRLRESSQSQRRWLVRR